MYHQRCGVLDHPPSARVMTTKINRSTVLPLHHHFSANFLIAAFSDDAASS
jgi:hypothetical protein